MPVAAAVSPGSSAFGVAMPPPPLVSATPAAAAASRVAVGRVIAAPLRIKALLVSPYTCGGAWPNCVACIGGGRQAERHGSLGAAATAPRQRR